MGATIERCAGVRPEWRSGRCGAQMQRTASERRRAKRKVNQRFLSAMMDMGIPTDKAELALSETGNVGVEVGCALSVPLLHWSAGQFSQAGVLSSNVALEIPCIHATRCYRWWCCKRPCWCTCATSAKCVGAGGDGVAVQRAGARAGEAPGQRPCHPHGRGGLARGPPRRPAPPRAAPGRAHLPQPSPVTPA